MSLEGKLKSVLNSTFRVALCAVALSYLNFAYKELCLKKNLYELNEFLPCSRQGEYVLDDNKMNDVDGDLTRLGFHVIFTSENSLPQNTKKEKEDKEEIRKIDEVVNTKGNIIIRKSVLKSDDFKEVLQHERIHKYLCEKLTNRDEIILACAYCDNRKTIEEMLEIVKTKKKYLRKFDEKNFKMAKNELCDMDEFYAYMLCGTFPDWFEKRFVEKAPYSVKLLEEIKNSTKVDCNCD